MRLRPLSKGSIKMAYIKVNHKKMLDAAERIDDYIVRLDKNMNSIDSAMLALGGDWKGTDYQQVRKEWCEINSSGSTTDKMKTSLKNYASSIREAAKLYKEVQSRAINRAKTLCK